MEIEYRVDRIEGLKDERWLYAVVEVNIEHGIDSQLPAFKFMLEVPLPQDFDRSIAATRDMALSAARRLVNEAEIEALTGAQETGFT